MNCHLPQSKAPGIQVWEEKENIPNMSFGKADTDHNQPSFSQEPGCGFSPPSQEVGDSGQYQDPGHRPGELAPPNSPGPQRLCPAPGQVTRTLLY